ncbi:MAG: transcription termination/antitermination protein NusA [Chlamydiae bacterium]|nr:transcription termination/antitermination protein NusA [Chlamydiota bacterium]
MNKDLIAIFEYLEREKGIKREIVLSAIEDSLRIAARKTIKTADENIDIKINSKTGDIEVLIRKKIVEKVKNPDEEISLTEALKLTPDCKIGQRLEIAILPQDFGRIAAQTAKQIITQKLKGAERDVIYEEYRHRMNEIISGTVKRFARGRTIVVDLGKVEAILPDRNYPIIEKHHVGERIQALLLDVKDTDGGGAEVILTRSHPEFVKALFMQEVPEVRDGIVLIEKIVRDGGYRTKMVVRSTDPRIDPVGTCVGVRGTRIKNVKRELNNEIIDVILYSQDALKLLQNILAPIEIKRLKVNDKIIIVVNDDDYPAVLGKKGMNARLISKLIGMELEVQKLTEFQKLLIVQMAELSESTDPILDEQPLKIEGLSNLIVESLVSSDFNTIRKITQTAPADLTAAVPGLNYLDLADKIVEQIKKKPQV